MLLFSYDIVPRMSKIDLATVDAIIFDLGGVLIEVDMEKPYQKIMELSPNKSPQLLDELRSIAYQYEVGKIEDNTFLEAIRERAALDLPLAEIEAIWQEMLGDFPDYVGEFLAQISNNKRTFILSNTNHLHIKKVVEKFRANHPSYSWENLFEKIFYSYEIGLHKPDTKIYQYVIEHANLEPAKTLFIDDNYNNIIGAQKCGLKTLHLNPPMTLWQWFGVSHGNRG